MKAKTLGILGLGSQSTLFYIKGLNALYNKISGGYSTCPFKMLNTNFDEINKLLPQRSWRLDAIVKKYIDELISFNIDIILVPNITLHQTLDRINIGPAVIHPLQRTISEIKKKKHDKVVLFGSGYTMQSGYIKSYFADSGIEVSLPAKNDMLYVDEIRKQVYRGSETNESIEDFNLIIKKYAQNNAVVIACTELSLASINENIKVFDMARIQIKHSVNAIVNY